MTEGHSCGHHGGHENEQQEMEILSNRMGKIKNKVLVLSGKGGVGKSTVSVNLAVSLALSGKKVGLLDIDIHGPSIPKLLKMEKAEVTGNEETINPVEYGENLKVMSIGFLMQGQEEAIIWRGPMKHSVIKQFLMHVEWGDLDYLVVDSPPGTGDEPLSIAQFLAQDAQAVIVTTPQEIALEDVKKSIQFCRKLSLPMLGMVENMSGFACPHCGKESDIFRSGGGEELAGLMEMPFLGRIPIDPDMVLACDSGEPFMQQYKDSATAQAIDAIIKPILEQSKS